MSQVKQITIGIAGHIDHGKTSLVQKLTGKNTDNLKEEIKRGMTINIGFAHLNEQICLIDVPGHENFIKNMIAGVCNIDFAILVIAADDGIMPQTIEHFEILSLLGVKSGVVVINKIDLVDKEWIELVQNDIKEKFKNTFLNLDNIFLTSTVEDIGIDKLNEFICSIDVIEKYDRGVFRMFIDRVFSKTGFGNVVTGTVSSGKVKVGDKLKILPQGKLVKIRGLQSHDSKVDGINVGDRGAINLHSLDKISIKRGNHLSNIDSVQMTENAIVKIKILSKYMNKIKDNQRVRFLLGTQEVMARIFILKKNDDIKEMIFLVKFEKKIIACFNDRFIIRSYSPVNTIGGGSILDTKIIGKWKANKEYASLLFDDKENESNLVKLVIQNNKEKICKLDEISLKLGLSKKTVLSYIKKDDVFLFGDKQNPWLLTRKQKKYIYERTLRFLEEFHNNNKYSNGVTKEQINNIFNFNVSLLNDLLKEFIKDNKINSKEEIFFLKDFEVNLSDKEKEIQKNVYKILNQEEFNTSSLKDLSIVNNYEESKLLRLMKIDDSIITINSNYIITKLNYQKLLNIINLYFRSNNTLSVKDFKEITNTSRKFAVPLLEYLDKQKITYRTGNERKKNN
tara:strand:+ start:1697 stop:3562 length:1866 start_codon:yes stop_codon:yes gene_type:complete